MKKNRFTFKEAKELLTGCARTSQTRVTEMGLCERWVWDKYIRADPKGYYNRVASGYNNPDKAEVTLWQDEKHVQTEFKGKKAKELVRLGGCGLPKDYGLDPQKMF